MNKPDIINRTRELAESLGRTPTIREFLQHINVRSHSIVYRNFDSWNDVIDAVGLPRNHTNTKGVSVAALIRQLKDLASELKRVPTLSEFQAHKETFSSGSVMRHFGTWNNFLKAAGFDVRQQMSLGITRETLIAQVKMLHGELGRIPTSTEFGKDSRTAGLSVINNRFGNYSNLLKSAGFKPNTNIQVKNRISNDELISQLQTMAKNLGRIPTVTEFKANPSTHSGNIAIIRFGTWNNFVRAAGFKPTMTKATGISKEELIKQVKELAIKLHRQPRYSDFSAKNGTASAGTVIKRFGSWNNFLKAAGIK